MKEESDDIITETLADLYFRQGMKVRARRIYEKLLKANPRNERIRNKLRSLGSSQVEEAQEFLSKSEEADFQNTMAAISFEGKEKNDDPPRATLDFQKLDEMYSTMGREKTIKKIKMLRGLLEQLRR